MLAGVRAVAGLLVGARESELGRSVQRIQLERVLEGVNRLGKLFELRVSGAQEVPGVGVAVVNGDDVLEIFDRCFGVAAVLVQHAERVPDVRVVFLRLGSFCRLLQDCLCRINLGEGQ